MKIFNCHTECQQILGVSVQNLLSTATWSSEIVQPCIRCRSCSL